MNKYQQQRIQYLGFDDRWFTFIGIVFLSFVTDFIFTNSFSRYPFVQAVGHWSMSLFFATCDWLILRNLLLFLRRKYPSLKDNLKRVLYLFLATVFTVIFLDLVGGSSLTALFDLSFNLKYRYKVIVPIIIVSTMTMAIYEGIYLFIKLKKSIREEEQAKQIAVQAQLDTLRNQAQPHFLFNSLNTLRDIIDQNTKEEAQDFVDKLSSVYRYILESGTHNTIPLASELEFAKAYIHIQKERFGNNLQLQWDIPQSLLQAYVIPMSIQLLLENAIKHNVISKAKPLQIKITATPDHISVRNNYQPRSTRVASTGLGLKNIKKGYALLSNHKVTIQQDNAYFCVQLPLLNQPQEIPSHATTYH